MKTFEVEFKQTSYVVTAVQADDIEDAIDKAWLWYESWPNTMDVSTELNYAKELP